MEILETAIPDLYSIEPRVFKDERGWFYESWSERDLFNQGLSYHFVQDNHSYSAKKGTLRGLHLQKGEAAQAKLVRCTRGAIIDVAVDLRRESETFLNWQFFTLSEENKRMVLIPRGFAHGFLTLTDDVEIVYKADNYYNKEAERSIRFDDKALGIDWGYSSPEEKERLILSDKDRNAPFLDDCWRDIIL